MASTWSTFLGANPFARALEVVRAAEALKQKSKPKVEAEAPMSAADRREALKMQQYMRQFEEQEAKEARRKKMQAMKVEREAADPCTCGRSRGRRVPKPLCAGGPRCNQCTPLELPKREAPREAPTFYPTEEEFVDPMEYIRKIQPEVYEYGICRIQPPASWAPPTSFHWRETLENDDEDAGPMERAPQLAPRLGSSAPEPEAGDSASGDSQATATPNDEEDAEATMQRMPALQHQRSVGLDYMPIEDGHAFSARLQGVRQRRHCADAGLLAPFICSFTSNYAKYTISQLREMDRSFRDDTFPTLDGRQPPSEDVESWFWDGLAAQGDAKILYSSDLEGTAFPDSGTYGEHKWSLQALCDHEQSLLRFLEYSIPGVNTPMLYFGMLFSMFCWHVEDNWMYSVSYLHEGAPKTWYGVGAHQADAFDRVFASTFKQATENDPQLLLKKAAMLPPATLQANGIDVCHLVQQPGMFVLTMPQAYHSGFSHGFNTAEAVNFMLPDWIPYAKQAVTRYQQMSREPVIDLEQILVSAAAANHSLQVAAELEAIACDEIRLRAELRDARVGERLLFPSEAEHNLGRGPPCAVCGHLCHLTYVQVESRATVCEAAGTRGGKAGSPPLVPSRQLVCLRHAASLSMVNPPDSPLTMLLRHDDSTLRGLARRCAAALESTPERHRASTLPVAHLGGGARGGGGGEGRAEPAHGRKRARTGGGK